MAGPTLHKKMRAALDTKDTSSVLQYVHMGVVHNYVVWTSIKPAGIAAPDFLQKVKDAGMLYDVLPLFFSPGWHNIVAREAGIDPSKVTGDTRNELLAFGAKSLPEILSEHNLWDQVLPYFFSPGWHNIIAREAGIDPSKVTGSHRKTLLGLESEGDARDAFAQYFTKNATHLFGEDDNRDALWVMNAVNYIATCYNNGFWKMNSEKLYKLFGYNVDQPTAEGNHAVHTASTPGTPIGSDWVAVTPQKNYVGPDKSSADATRDKDLVHFVFKKLSTVYLDNPEQGINLQYIFPGLQTAHTKEDIKLKLAAREVQKGLNHVSQPMSLDEKIAAFVLLKEYEDEDGAAPTDAPAWVEGQRGNTSASTASAVLDTTGACNRPPKMPSSTDTAPNVETEVDIRKTAQSLVAKIKANPKYTKLLQDQLGDDPKDAEIIVTIASAMPGSFSNRLKDASGGKITSGEFVNNYVAILSKSDLTNPNGVDGYNLWDLACLYNKGIEFVGPLFQKYIDLGVFNASSHSLYKTPIAKGATKVLDFLSQHDSFEIDWSVGMLCLISTPNARSTQFYLDSGADTVDAVQSMQFNFLNGMLRKAKTLMQGIKDTSTPPETVKAQKATLFALIKVVNLLYDADKLYLPADGAVANKTVYYLQYIDQKLKNSVFSEDVDTLLQGILDNLTKQYTLSDIDDGASVATGASDITLYNEQERLNDFEPGLLGDEA